MAAEIVDNSVDNVKNSCNFSGFFTGGTAEGVNDL